MHQSKKMFIYKKKECIFVIDKYHYAQKWDREEYKEGKCDGEKGPREESKPA